MSLPEQSADGTPHLAYFDKKTQLSFVWAGSLEKHIEVSHGGYGEPVIDTIDPKEHFHRNYRIKTIASWMSWFEMVCVSYIITHMRGEEGGRRSG